MMRYSRTRTIHSMEIFTKSPVSRARKGLHLGNWPRVRERPVLAEHGRTMSLKPIRCQFLADGRAVAHRKVAEQNGALS